MIQLPDLLADLAARDGPDATALYLGLGQWVKQAHHDGAKPDDVFWSLLSWAMNIHASLADTEAHDDARGAIQEILIKALAGETPPLGKPVKVH